MQKATASPQTPPHPWPRPDSWGMAFFGALFAGVMGAFAPPAFGQERETIPKLADAGVTSMALSPDGKLLCLVGANYTLTLFDLRGRKKVGSLEGWEKVIARAVFSPNGKTLATRNRWMSVKLWAVPSLKPKGQFGTKDFLVHDLAYSPDGRLLAAAGSKAKGRGFEDLVKLWDTTSGREVASWPGHRGYTTCLAFAPDGRTLYSGGRDGAVKFWDVNKGEQRAEHQIFDRPVLSLDASKDGKMLAVGSEAGIVLWDLATDKLHRRLKWDGRWVRFSPDSKALGGAGSSRLPVWEVATGKLRAQLEGHKQMIFAVLFSPDGKTLLTAAADRAVKLWDMPNLEEDD